MRTARHPVPAAPLRALAALLVLAGCGSDLTLPPATLPIAQQEIQLYALTGTPASTSSAYNMILLGEVRTDLTNDFDFAFDLRFDSAYGLGNPNDTVAVLLPRGMLGFALDPGLQVVPTFNFDSLKLAPADGYVKDRPARIHEGDVLFASSRVQTCNFGFVRPHYAKLVIEKIELDIRKATIRLVIDPNCGYRDVSSGIPSQ